MNKLTAVEINKENVLPIDSWKTNIAVKKEEKALAEYYSLLGFHDLVVDAHSMVQELSNKELCKDMGLRAKALLAEFQKRTQSQGSEHSKGLAQVAQSLTNNVQRLLALN